MGQKFIDKDGTSLQKHGFYISEDSLLPLRFTGRYNNGTAIFESPFEEEHFVDQQNVRKFYSINKPTEHSQKLRRVASWMEKNVLEILQTPNLLKTLSNKPHKIEIGSLH